MVEKMPPRSRDYYKAFRLIGTRWSDNDIYGHMNNVVHYGLFDTAVNMFLIEKGVLDITHGTEVFLVVETGCRYFGEMSFPDTVCAGIRVAKVGSSSIRYEVGLFRNDETTASAEGFFVHVNVGRKSRQPVRISEKVRAILEPLTGL